MSNTSDLKVWGLPAAADLSAKYGYAVDCHQAEGVMTLCDTDAGPSDGPLQNAPEAGETANVPYVGCRAEFAIGGNVSAGAFLTPQDGGLWIATTTNGDWIGGRAVEGGVSGDVISGVVMNGFHYVSA